MRQSSTVVALALIGAVSFLPSTLAFSSHAGRKGMRTRFAREYDHNLRPRTEESAGKRILHGFLNIAADKLDEKHSKHLANSSGGEASGPEDASADGSEPAQRRRSLHEDEEEEHMHSFRRDHGEDDHILDHRHYDESDHILERRRDEDDGILARRYLSEDENFLDRRHFDEDNNILSRRDFDEDDSIFERREYDEDNSILSRRHHHDGQAHENEEDEDHSHLRRTFEEEEEGHWVQSRRALDAIGTERLAFMGGSLNSLN